MKRRIRGVGALPARAPALRRIIAVALETTGVWDDRCDLDCASPPLATKLERIDADSPGSWRIMVRPAAEVPIEATRVREDAVGLFVEVLRTAKGFGTRGLRVGCERKLKSREMKDLRQAMAAYSHVGWS